ncbi:MAG TPA: N-formylglutamate amidohydrolase [Dongiaceae bacterium]|jgi:N-formylglutamate deformylase|nr:N-formylglutamate amidohydrolase [Dongiaceae bacterium]
MTPSLAELSPQIAFPQHPYLLMGADMPAPVILTLGHSGRFYPPRFLAQSRLSLAHLRLSEDAYLDKLCVPAAPPPTLVAQVARLYVDVNRHPGELDPRLIEGPLPDYALAQSQRVHAGLGVVPRTASGGEDIYAETLSVADIEARLDRYHRPFHEALAGLIKDARHRWGAALILDFHSMPSSLGNGTGSDVVLGDCHGQSCSATLIECCERYFHKMGAVVRRNDPYAGGFITHHYGHPDQGVHALQIEINRGLYMNEATLRPERGFAALQERLQHLSVYISQKWQDLLQRES